MNKRVFACCLLGGLWLAGCANQPPVPVSERSIAPSAAADEAPLPPGYYTVKKGDTLYAIALNHGQNYRDIVAWNALENPNRIEIGQRLRVARPDEKSLADGSAVAVAIPVPAARDSAAPAGDALKREPKGGKEAYSEQALARLRGDMPKPAAAPAATAQNAAPAAANPAAPIAPPVAAPTAASAWLWPVKGKLSARFAEGKSKGIDIEAKAGSPVYAAAAGKVTYTGNRIPGYGNLLVIRHDDQLLSVYAHNSKILVAEKQSVSKGQKIAEVGSSDAEQAQLHFEIRRQGVPVDPLKYLPEKQ